MIKNKSKTMLAFAFAALAGVALVKGYVAQRKSDSKPCQTAYSYTAGNKFSPSEVSGKVGTDTSGIEYKVSDFNNPKVEVAAKPSKKSSVEYKARRGRASYSAYASSKISNLDAKVEYGRRTSKTQVNGSANFDTWLQSAAFTYLENYGKEKKVIFNLGFDVWSRKFNWTPSYDFNAGTVHLGYVKKA